MSLSGLRMVHGSILRRISEILKANRGSTFSIIRKIEPSEVSKSLSIEHE